MDSTPEEWVGGHGHKSVWVCGYVLRNIRHKAAKENFLYLMSNYYSGFPRFSYTYNRLHPGPHIFSQRLTELILITWGILTDFTPKKK